MGEIYIKCVECGNQLDEAKWELMWDSYYISVFPCETCMEEAIITQERVGGHN
jgi:hypothetical protein